MIPNNWIPRVGDRFTYLGYDTVMTVTEVLHDGQVRTVDKTPSGSETTNTWMYGPSYQNIWLPRKKITLIIKECIDND